ncbi:hypothetical protein DINM_006953 [Dirofilaria immitis]|nr:hypothetical protein [Dirofilaria immitis]
MNKSYYDRWADNNYEQLSESCRLGPTNGVKSNSSASRSFENAELQESTELEMNRYYGLTEAIVRMDYIQNMLNKITRTNKSAEFCRLLEDFLHNIEEMRLKLQAILSPFANLEQFSTDFLPVTDANHSTASTITSATSRSVSSGEQT